MVDRKQQLLQLGFEENGHQQCFYNWIFEQSWYVDSYRVYEDSDDSWDNYLEKIKSDLKEAEKQFYLDIRSSFEYNFAEKEFKKKIRDYYNKYNSWLKEETSPKLGRSPNFKRETELRAKVDCLKEILNKITPKESNF